ncbi:conserved hypothetical protein [Ricinus communis]|uniref:Uncharacterized protein n=1 Tax=Ricinus communis TaxID=3988 RepID=B9RYD0_RICCO|nr:conserved hypothetical protein [Ricinus communis]
MDTMITLGNGFLRAFVPQWGRDSLISHLTWGRSILPETGEYALLSLAEACV